MKVSELWLRSLIDLPLPIKALGEQLTQAGIEVDHLEIGDKTKQGILTLKVPPNRGDCLSMEGIAREISVLNQMPYTPIVVSSPRAQHQEMFPVRLETKTECARYVGCVVKNVNNTAASPLWLKERLEMASIKSISAVVDILNYVMLELGQPLHAFDVRKLDQEITVRRAKAEEKITLLNHQEIRLTADSVVIADKTQVRALAGILGGLDSAVTEQTTAVWLESAYFDPIAIRLTAKRYGLRTEASYRFERGIDPLLPKRALERSLQLIKEITGGEIGTIVEHAVEASLPKPLKLLLRKKRISQVLGMEIAEPIILDILKRLGMEVLPDAEGFMVSPPLFRHDITLEIDLIEEIARIYGLHRLPTEIPIATFNYPFLSEQENSLKSLKALLVNRGYHEIISYSFIDSPASQLGNPHFTPLTLSNPIAANMAAMRTSLWPGLLQAIQHNQRRQHLRNRFFEMGICFLEKDGKWVEQNRLSGIVIGPLYPEQWGIAARSVDFYDVKSDLEALFTLGEKESFCFEKAEYPALHPGQTARILKQGNPVGYMGVLHPNLIKTYELEGPAIAFELEVSYLQKAKVTCFHPLSKFPSIRRDIAILVNKSLLVADLKSAIAKCTGKLLKQLMVFDIYQGKGIEPGKKSVALGLILQDPSRTLIEEEIAILMKEVVTMLSNQFQAVLRDDK